jgi:hypothetical protein
MGQRGVHYSSHEKQMLKQYDVKQKDSLTLKYVCA